MAYWSILETIGFDNAPLTAWTLSLDRMLQKDLSKIKIWQKPDPPSVACGGVAVTYKFPRYPKSKGACSGHAHPPFERSGLGRPYGSSRYHYHCFLPLANLDLEFMQPFLSSPLSKLRPCPLPVPPEPAESPP